MTLHHGNAILNLNTENGPADIYQISEVSILKHLLSFLFQGG